jgi:Carboxypeptidase regulatory-like domain
MVKAYLSIFSFLSVFVLLASSARAQQTLGSINGTVTDSSGAVVQGATVKVRNVDTGLEQTTTSKNDGSFNIADLPIGTYTVAFRKDGFKTEVHSKILVQGNRTSTVNASLQPGEVSASVTVTATPLLNQTDNTNGYVLGTDLIESTPLGTGSFTQLAILAPGVSADLLNTTGTNAGLGNQSIWANGQRDTSNSFTFNGVSANNIFNGKSSSQLTGNRVVLNTGEVFGSGGDIQTGTSVYAAIGQALPTPPPETVEELHVNTSMYDASQGANSGAHISLITKSGTNDFHGGAYEYHQTDAWNAAPFFFNAVGLPRPVLHRNVFGGTLGGPIKKEKLFFFASYQGQRVADQENGISFAAVPTFLTNDRSDAGLITAASSSLDPTGMCGQPGHPACFTGTIDPVARKILNAKAPDGSYIVPSAAPTQAQRDQLQSTHFATAVVQGPPSRFQADQVNGNIDYIFGPKDRFAAKYYYQRDPNVTPFAESQVLGFPQTLHAGSQVLSLSNTTILTPNLSWDQRFGFLRQTAFANTAQSLGPSDVGINAFGSKLFPTINIHFADANIFPPNSTINPNGFYGNSLSIGPIDNFAHAGIFQNTFEGASNLNWVHGRHTISTGFTWDYIQLNVLNKNNQDANLTFEDFAGFLQGQLCGPSNSCFGQGASFFLNGASNRYYRAQQVGSYVQENFKIRSNLSVNLGLRWDWDGPLYEKNGLLTNFYRQNYSYDPVGDVINNIGLVVAGNNKVFPTKGVSKSTLTGRQWGFAPRIGAVWSPSFLKNFVIRAGFGMYYDRGEFFTEFSPGAGGDISGPFGVTVAPPFVVQIFAPQATSSTGPGSFSSPFGSGAPPPPPTSLAGVASLVPNATQLVNTQTTFCNSNGIPSGCGPFFFGGYDPNNKLPYSENWNLDLQWQPYNTLLVNVAYIGNHGVHLVMPIPFNQARIATPQNPALKGGVNQQNFSYAYNTPGVAAESLGTIVAGFPQGNIDLRVPFIGYEANSDFNEAEGISNYHALQAGVTKRLSHGLLVTGSYTWSHALDEQSALGLFFNGNDPLSPRSAYGNADFDRTHVFTVSYQYTFPTLPHASAFVKRVVNGWGFGGITVLQSGQPYSVIDFSGSVGSIFWGTQDFITNPIVPVGGMGSQKVNPNAQGTTGVNAGKPVLNAGAFGPPTPFAPGTNGVPPCDPNTGACDIFENGYGAGGRNIFRGPFQSRFDFSVFKDFKLNERFHLRYDAQLFNIFNHPSFDTPNNNVKFSPGFPNPPAFPAGPMGAGTCGPSNLTFDSNGHLQPPTPGGAPAGAFQCPPSGQLGVIQHTIGSPRFVQMALHLAF